MAIASPVEERVDALIGRLTRLLQPDAQGVPPPVTEADIDDLTEMANSLTPEDLSAEGKHQLMTVAAACLEVGQVGRVQLLAETCANIWPEEQRQWPVCVAEAAITAVGQCCSKQNYGLALALARRLNCYADSLATLTAQMNAKGQTLARLVTQCLVQRSPQ